MLTHKTYIKIKGKKYNEERKKETRKKEKRRREKRIEKGRKNGIRKSCKRVGFRDTKRKPLRWF